MGTAKNFMFNVSGEYFAIVGMSVCELLRHILEAKAFIAASKIKAGMKEEEVYKGNCCKGLMKRMANPKNIISKMCAAQMEFIVEILGPIQFMGVFVWNVCGWNRQHMYIFEDLTCAGDIPVILLVLAINAAVSFIYFIIFDMMMKKGLHECCKSFYEPIFFHVVNKYWKEIICMTATIHRGWRVHDHEARWYGPELRIPMVLRLQKLHRTQSH